MNIIDREKNYYEIYTDESGTSKPDKYMMIGGFIINRLRKIKIENDLNKIIQESCITDEIKWQKVNKYNYSKYINIIDYLFENREYLYYKSIVIQKSKVNDRKYNNGDSNIGFYKFYYQLIYHGFCSEIHNGDKLFLRMDEREVNYSLENLKNIFNSSYKNRDIENPVREIIPKNSKDDVLIQVSDLITGGIRFAINKDCYPDSSCWKPDFSDYIINKWGLQRNVNIPYESTKKSKRFMSIWHFKLSD